MNTIDKLLGSLKVWRWLRGGVWEQWKMDEPGDPLVWFHRERPTRERGSRPLPSCRGIPTVEDYRTVTVRKMR